jgi:hypothetical protein
MTEIAFTIVAMLENKYRELSLHNIEVIYRSLCLSGLRSQRCDSKNNNAANAAFHGLFLVIFIVIPACERAIMSGKIPTRLMAQMAFRASPLLCPKDRRGAFLT